MPAPDSSHSVTPKLVRAIGYVEPDSEIRKLTFQVDGVIATCPVQVDQTIAEGDVLATLQNRDERATVVVAEKKLAVAKAERTKLLSGVHPQEVAAAERRIERLQERVRYAESQRDRQLRLFERNADTEEAFDQAKTDLTQAKEVLAESQAELDHLKMFVRLEDEALADSRVELAAANLLSAQERLRDTVLTATMPGTVLEILKREGEAVRSFDPQPVIVFADLSQLRLRAEVDERYVSLLKVGQKAVIFGRGLGERRVPGKVALLKTLMGNKTVFTRDAAERKDLDVLQVFVIPEEPLNVPIGLQVDIDLTISEEP